VGCDASMHGICVVLNKEVRPHSFESSQVKGNKLLEPIYEKEMLAILHAFKK
jgi:hypothetical protein